jgi:hypothetical protein
MTKVAVISMSVFERVARSLIHYSGLPKLGAASLTLPDGVN